MNFTWIYITPWIRRQSNLVNRTPVIARKPRPPTGQFFLTEIFMLKNLKNFDFVEQRRWHFRYVRTLPRARKWVFCVIPRSVILVEEECLELEGYLILRHADIDFGLSIAVMLLSFIWSVYTVQTARILQLWKAIYWKSFLEWPK